MKDKDLEDPLPKGAKTIGIIYNLKKGAGCSSYDDEAEYDSIDTINAIKAALETRNYNVILLEADKALPEKLRSARYILISYTERAAGNTWVIYHWTYIFIYVIINHV